MESKGMPTAPPPYVEHAEGQQAPYGFTTNVSQPHPQGPYMQPPTGGYGYQSGYGPPQPGYAPPQPGYGPPQPGYMPVQPGTQTVQSVSHPGVTHTINVQPQGSTTIVVVGGCPVCRTGTLEENYTCLGICCAIFCFPIGILCCLSMKEKRCSNCHATF